jgi:hypothetical protein
MTIDEKQRMTFPLRLAMIRQQRLAVVTGEFEVAKRHPLRALKVFAMILFDVIAEIRHDRKYRKEFKA